MGFCQAFLTKPPKFSQDFLATHQQINLLDEPANFLTFKIFVFYHTDHLQEAYTFSKEYKKRDNVSRLALLSVIFYGLGSGGSTRTVFKYTSLL